MANEKPTISEIADKYSAYVKGDIKKCHNEIKQYYDVVSINVSNEWGCKLSTILYVDDEGDFVEETIQWG